MKNVVIDATRFQEVGLEISITFFNQLRQFVIQPKQRGVVTLTHSGDAYTDAQ